MDETQERPLVTFALFAYNQEKYIREAIEGAFSQTYQPLEIILSDDCSTDRTFEIMQEMAAAYQGPHKVKCVKNGENFGLIRHFNRVVQIASAKYIVLAAGDDISVSERSELIMKEFRRSKPLLIHSDVEYICSNGSILEDRPEVNTYLKNSNDVSGAALSGELYIGATGAIDKYLIEKYGPIVFLDSYEDLVLGYRAAMEGRISYIDAPLVRYRWDVGITAITSKQLSWIQNKEARKKGARLMRAVFEQRHKDALIYKYLDHKVHKKLRRGLRYWRVRHNFLENSIMFWVGMVMYPVLSARIIASEIKLYLLSRRVWPVSR